MIVKTLRKRGTACMTSTDCDALDELFAFAIVEVMNDDGCLEQHVQEAYQAKDASVPAELADAVETYRGAERRLIDVILEG
jgi:hypothetical protein